MVPFNRYLGGSYFSKGIYSKVNVIVPLEFKLSYTNSAVQHFNHYTVAFILTQWIIKTTGAFFRNIYLSLYVLGFERVVWGFTVRGSWSPIRNCNILTTLLWPSALCLSCSPDAQPEAQSPSLLGDGFLFCILSASSLDSNSLRGPDPLRAGVAFLTTSRQ